MMTSRTVASPSSASEDGDDNSNACDGGGGGTRSRSDDICDDDDGCGDDSNNHDVHDENNNNDNNTENDDDNFPWEWYKAMKDILNSSTITPPVGSTIISPIPELPVQILPWLYIAPMSCVQNHEEYLSKELGITHVISMNRMVPHLLETFYWTLRSYDIDQLYIDALDTLDYNILNNHWEECRTFVQEQVLVPVVNGDENTTTNRRRHDNVEENDDDDDGRQQQQQQQQDDDDEPKYNKTNNNKLLVHCAAGMNRSGLIVAAIMIYFEHMDLLNVITQLKCKRGYVLSNESFQKELVLFAQKHHLLGPYPHPRPPT